MYKMSGGLQQSSVSTDAKASAVGFAKLALDLAWCSSAGGSLSPNQVGAGAECMQVGGCRCCLKMTCQKPEIGGNELQMRTRQS